MTTATLDCLAPGQQATVQDLTFPAPKRRRLLDLGFVPGAAVTALQAAPWGDPMAYGVRGAVIALRRTDAHNISIVGK